MTFYDLVGRVMMRNEIHRNPSRSYLAGAATQVGLRARAQCFGG